MRRLSSLTRLFGIDGAQCARAVWAVPGFLRDYRRFRAQPVLGGDFPLGKLYPCFTDHSDSSGLANGHYFHQDLLVARMIFKRNPDRHVDVGSRVDGFVAHVACFREIDVFDIRPLQATVTNIRFRQADLMSDFPQEFKNYCDSLSCLHTLEHFGLGRYGDPINPNGHLEGFRNLTEILRPGGTLYFSVPIGPQRVEFNAHRVFSINYLLAMFQTAFEVVSFSFVDDAGDLHENAELAQNDAAMNFGCNYGCGIFELRKHKAL